MSTISAQGSGGTNNNVGRFSLFGQVNSPTWGGLAPTRGPVINAKALRGGQTGVKHALEGEYVEATNVLDANGKCNFTRAAHGLAIGDIIQVKDADAASLNTVHRVVRVPYASGFITNVNYEVSADAGKYAKQLGDFSQAKPDHFVSVYLTKGELAGVATDVLRGPSQLIHSSSLHRYVTARQIDATTWNAVTGVVSYGANAGAQYSYITAKGEGTVDITTVPARTNPGVFVYTKGSASPSTQSYRAL